MSSGKDRASRATRAARAARAPRVVVVTGGSAGVGRAAVREFAHRGDLVAVLARGEEGIEAAVAEATQLGARALGVPVDVADHDQVEAAADWVEQALGPIDVWVNNAMASVFAPVWQTGPDEFQRATEVSYLGFVWGSRAALTRMLPRDRGVLVQVGSALAYRGIPLQSAYCGAKHAVVGFTESLRTELLHENSGVQVTMVHLPAMNTPQFDWVLSRLPRHPQPVPPIYQPEVAARMIVYAADHPRRAYWVGASTALTILGNRLAPGLLDRYLARRGFDSQQTDAVGHRLPPNLWGPSDGEQDQGAHGDFDANAHPRSPQTWASRHRNVLLPATVSGAAAGMAMARTAARTAARRHHGSRGGTSGAGMPVSSILYSGALAPVRFAGSNRLLPCLRCAGEKAQNARSWGPDELPQDRDRHWVAVADHLHHLDYREVHLLRSGARPRRLRHRCGQRCQDAHRGRSPARNSPHHCERRYRGRSVLDPQARE